MRVAGPQWPIPRIASITPDPVAAGSTMTIDGANFAVQPPAGSVALVHATTTSAGPVIAASVSSWTNNQVILSLPASAPTGDYVAVLFQGSVSGYAASPRFQVSAPVKYRYTCQWQGGLVLLDHVANVTVEALPDVSVAGRCTNFRTNDPYYKPLDGATINVFTAPGEFPGRYVVHNGLQGPQPVHGTWTFIQFYECRFNGRLEHLHHVANVSVENFPDAKVVGQCTDFLTHDPYYRTLDGHTQLVHRAVGVSRPGRGSQRSPGRRAGIWHLDVPRRCGLRPRRPAINRLG